MKVGIYDDGTIDRRGGGFTFKSEVISGLMKSEINSDVKIFMFGWKRMGHKESKYTKNIDYVYIQEPNLLRYLEFIRKSIHQCVKSLLFWMRKEKRKAIINPSINAMNRFAKLRAKIIEKKLLSHGVDLIIYMEAQEILTYKIPFICISWDLGHLYSPFFPETNFEKWETFEKLKSRALKCAVHIVVGTNVGKNQIHSQYRIPRSRISVIPFPTPIYLLKEKRKGLLKNQAGFDPEKDFLFYPASYWPHKNHFLLIEAMRSLINERNVNMNLVLCGSDKGNKRFVQKLVHKYQLNDNVFIFDFLERSEINYLYEKAFAMVFPSHIGPDNLPPLEAFGLGCPVLASAVEGAEEQLGNNALFFDPFNADDLIEKILLIKNDPTRRNDLIQRGLQKAKNWTSDDYAKSLISVVEEYRPYSCCYDLKTYKTMFA